MSFLASVFQFLTDYVPRMDGDLFLKRKRMEEDQHLLQSILDGAKDPTDLPLALLQDITDNFSEDRKIGQGGFGVVYKHHFNTDQHGVLGELIVAIKRIHINEYTIDDKLFCRELVSLWNTSHRNVVRFLGFCSNTHQKRIEDARSGGTIFSNVLERLLCFEYVSNGSLDKHITDELRGLKWEDRYEIITGICKGLRYLHKEKNIIHMDLKPANILLHHQGDKYMVPKITDFGLARPNENSYTLGKVQGTRGYMAPEYMEGSKATPACDIYSLGAIIIELVTGCKDNPNKNNVLRRWRHRWNKPPTQLQYQQVIRCIGIAERCREQKPQDRPSISNIISYLSESESTHSQISPWLDQNYMLGIKPLEIRLPSEMEEILCFTIELTNDTHSWIAFNIQQPGRQRYKAQPETGIVQPGTIYVVTITVQAQDVRKNDHADKFLVQSMQVEASDVIIEQMFKNTSKFVDKVDLIIMNDPMKPKENQKCREDTNMPNEEVLEEKLRAPGKEKLCISVCSEASSTCKFYPPQSFSRLYPTNKKYLGEESRAVGHARGAMGSLLDKLGKLTSGDYSLDESIKKEIDSFSVQLVNMNRDLHVLENVMGAKIWVDEVMELSYHIEDIVDGFVVDRSGLKEVMHESVIILENGITTHQKMGDVIRNIKDKVRDVSNRKKEYNINVSNVVANESTKVNIDPRMAMCRNKEQLIGIEVRRNELMRLFEEGGDVKKQYLRVVSIVGMGGSGKTTLAKAVYDELKGYPTKAFVSVGQDPNLTILLKKIIRDCQGQGYNAKKFKDLDEWQLINELHEYLDNKRFIIVIDDLWDFLLWDIIKSAFPRNNCGSRVITTTRIQAVIDGDSGNLENKVYKMKPLSDEDSRTLLLRRVPTQRNVFHLTPGKEVILTDILKRCGGMPLAINSIASHLARHPSESSWETARKSLGAVKGNDIENMKQILDLSYIHLPDHLKTCLLHVCMYPEDREIKKIDLLRQWVAEGFVSTEEGQDEEVVAEEYFEALIDMFMIQPGQIDYYSNEVLSCRVHDIILELMRSKSSKEKFIHVIDGLKDVSGQIRRVSVESNDNKDSRILETINKGSLEHVRSVLLYRSSFVPYFLKYNYVRVLHIVEPAYSQSILDLTGISRLFLLRYLKVEWSGLYGCVLKLPNQIGQLQQLETIDLKGCTMEKYPPDIVELPCLSHLLRRGHGKGIVLPDEIGRLKSLCTLVGVCVSGSTVENIKGLSELNNLRELHIQEQVINQGEATSIRMEALHSSICKLSASLRILYLRRWSDETYNIYYRYYWSSSIFPRVSNIRDLDLGFCSFRRCPPWIGQLHNLCKLRIVVRVVADAVSVVAGLPWLAYFEIFTESVAKKKETVVFSGSRGAFKALKDLRFYCPKASLTFEAGVLPKLEKLDILFRYHMARRFLPVGIQNLPSMTLKEIFLRMDENDFRKRFHDENDEYNHRDDLHERRFRIMLTRAFKPHHPAANIILDSPLYYPQKVDDSEDHEGVDDKEDCCSVKYFSSEEDEEDAYEVSGSETSAAQVHANTRPIELIEAEEDSGRMDTNIDVNQSPNELDYEEILRFNEDLTKAMGNLTIEVGDTYTSSQLPYTSLPSYHELRQSISELSQNPSPFFLGLPSLLSYLELIQPNLELSGQVQDSDSLQLPSISPPPSLDLVRPRSEINHGPSPSLLQLALALCSSPHTANVLSQGRSKLNDEEADDCAYQENGSQSSAQVQANTRQLVEVIERQEDSSRMSINTYVSPTSHPILLGCHGRTQDLGSLQAPFTRLDLYQAPPPGGSGLSGMADSDVDDNPSDSAFLDYLAMDTDEDDPSDGIFWRSDTAEVGELNHEEAEEGPQVQDNTRQSVELIEAQKDSGRTSILPSTVHLIVRSEGQTSRDTELENLPNFYLEPRSGLLYQALDWESLELPFLSSLVPSYLDLTQLRSELNQAPNELNVEEVEQSVDDTEADDAAYKENVSQTSASDEQEDFGMMSINPDGPPMSLHLGVRLDGRTEELESLQLPLTSLTNLALCSSPDRAEQCYNGMLVNVVGQSLDLSQAPPGGHASDQTEAVDDDPSPYAFWDNLVSDSDEGPNDNDNEANQDVSWDNLLMDL